MAAEDPDPEEEEEEGRLRWREGREAAKLFDENAFALAHARQRISPAGSICGLNSPHPPMMCLPEVPQLFSQFLTERQARD